MVRCVGIAEMCCASCAETLVPSGLMLHMIQRRAAHTKMREAGVRECLYLLIPI